MTGIILKHNANQGFQECHVFIIRVLNAKKYDGHRILDRGIICFSRFGLIFIRYQRSTPRIHYLSF